MKRKSGITLLYKCHESRCSIVYRVGTTLKATVVVSKISLPIGTPQKVLLFTGPRTTCRMSDSNGGGEEEGDDEFRPLSQTNAMLALQGALQRLLFACSMGLLALAGSALLWVVSLPSVAMRILRWQFSAVSEMTGLSKFYEGNKVFPCKGSPPVGPIRSAVSLSGYRRGSDRSLVYI